MFFMRYAFMLVRKLVFSMGFSVVNDAIVLIVKIYGLVHKKRLIFEGGVSNLR